MLSEHLLRIPGITQCDCVTTKEVRNQTSHLIRDHTTSGLPWSRVENGTVCRYRFCRLGIVLHHSDQLQKISWKTSSKMATITNDLEQLGVSMDDVREVTLWRELIHGAMPQSAASS